MDNELRRRLACGGLQAILIGMAGGCTLSTQMEAAQGLGAGEALPIVSGSGAFSPQPGDHYGDGLSTEVPLFGVTDTPNDPVTAYVFNGGTREWVLVGTTSTASKGRIKLGDRRVYPYDFGSACVNQACDVVLPLHAWRGFGPFSLAFRFFSEAQGWLDLAGVCAEGDGIEPCATAQPTAIEVRADPIPPGPDQ